MDKRGRIIIYTESRPSGRHAKVEPIEPWIMGPFDYFINAHGDRYTPLDYAAELVAPYNIVMYEDVEV